MKKGRHRRFEEARNLKRTTLTGGHRRCPECGALEGEEHAGWCLVEQDELEELLEDVAGNNGSGAARHAYDDEDPLLNEP